MVVRAPSRDGIVINIQGRGDGGQWFAAVEFEQSGGAFEGFGRKRTFAKQGLKRCAIGIRESDDVFFPTFFGLNLMFNDVISRCGEDDSFSLDRDGQIKEYSVNFLSADCQNQVTVAHEMGHGFGLPHSSGIDVMNGWFGSTHPDYGQVAVHTIAPFKDMLGWIPSSKKYIPVPGISTTITLERLALPQTSNYLMAQIPITDTFYTIEARNFAGYDQQLDGLEGVLIHHVDLTLLSNLNNYVAEAVQDSNARYTWQPGETFTDAANGITVHIESATSTGFQVTITVPKANQTINFAPLPNRGLKDSPFTITAITTSGLSMNFDATGVCTVNDTVVTLTALGTCTITAHQNGSVNYNAASDVKRSFMVLAKVYQPLISR
jgi:hypothetical protein